LGLQRVLFVPAGDPYRKTAGRDVTPADTRLQLVEAAVLDLPWAEVSRIEVERPGPTYSDETMTTLAADGGDWWFIVGSDVLLDLPHWHDPLQLIAAARLAVAVRPPSRREVPVETRRAMPGIEDRIDWLEMPPLEVSSSMVRRLVEQGEDVSEWLLPAVASLVDELGLYRSR
jgi:nicotinate-nucleotide adenylyltransferase